MSGVSFIEGCPHISGVAFIEGCPHIRGVLYRGVSSHQGYSNILLSQCTLKTYITNSAPPPPPPPAVRIVTQIQNLDSGPGAHVNGANSYYKPPAVGAWQFN